MGCKKYHLTLTTPLLGKSFHRQGGTCYGKSMYQMWSHEAMNGGAKCRKWGGLGQLEGNQGHGQCHYSIDRIFDFNRNCFRYLLQLFVQSHRFWPTHLWRPRRRWSWSNFAEIFGVRKLGYRVAIVCVTLRLAVLVELWRVADTDTDRQTDRHRPMDLCLLTSHVKNHNLK